MAWQGQAVLAVVPARGGSKGIPRKNLRPVGGQSLVAHAARVATALPWIDRAVLTTDDPEIAAEGRRHGLAVPFMRPAELATDTATGAAAWRHAWLASEAHYGCRFEFSVLLQPTTPLRSPDEVERTLRALTEGPYLAAATVSRLPGHFTPQKALTMDPAGRLHFYHAEGAAHSIRQTIPDYYYRNGLCYAVRRGTLIDKGQIVEEDCVGVLIDRYVVNIDEPIELEIADFLASRDGAVRPGSGAGES